MKTQITNEEAKNIIASCNKDELQRACEGTFKKFHVEKNEEGYSLEYIYNDLGDLKEKFAK